MPEEFEPIDEEDTEGHAPGRLMRAGGAIRGLAVDLTPLRISRGFRLLWTGQMISLTGRQITQVALPAQVFLLTHSSLDVGLIGLAQLFPILFFSIAGSPLADRLDRRKLILSTECMLAATSALLLLGALHGRPPLWYLYVVAAAQAAVSGLNSPARSAAIPNLVPKDRLPAALALNQVMFNTTVIAGPALAGLILAQLGVAWAYGVDVVTFGASITAAFLLGPLVPRLDAGRRPATGWEAIREGFAFVRRSSVLVSTFVIDLNAMIFGMPRALFPALALDTFHAGLGGLGLLYAAPGVGALIGALSAGWVGRVRHQGQAVLWSVAVWGAAITAFGLAGDRFVLALAMLAIGGGADVISAVFRSTILQLSVPDALRGRLSAIHLAVVTGGPRLGDLEAGAVGSAFTPEISVVSGGLACLAGVGVVALAFPALRRYHAADPLIPPDQG